MLSYILLKFADLLDPMGLITVFNLSDLHQRYFIILRLPPLITQTNFTSLANTHIFKYIHIYSNFTYIITHIEYFQTLQIFKIIKKYHNQTTPSKRF